MISSSNYINGVARGMTEEGVQTSHEFYDYLDLSNYGSDSNTIIEPVPGE